MDNSSPNSMKFNLVVCGGTFDHLHKGHQALLKLALSLGNKVIIAVTSETFVKNLKSVEPFETRKNAVIEFIKSENSLEKVEIIEINDLFGPTLSKDLKIDAIVVSQDTKKGADTINKKREDLSLAPLKVYVVPSVVTEDGELVSSSRIRGGQISRIGQSYINPLWLKKDLVLPESLREELKKPFGELTNEINLDDSSYVITVGDETSKRFNRNKIKQNLSVVDFKIARKERFSSFSELGFSGDEEVIQVDNPPGHITSSLFIAVSRFFKSSIEKKRSILKVAGEEDLVVLPLILFSPLNSVIFYGQPSKGLVKVVVSESAKNKAYDLVSRLKPIETHTRGY